MEVRSVTEYGWFRDQRMVRNVITYDYERGNDVTRVEYHYYQVYGLKGQIVDDKPKGQQVDLSA